MKIDVRLYNPELRTRDDLFSRAARCVAEAAILSNRALIRARKEAGKPLPLLYDTGVLYKNEEPGRPDECLDIPKILIQGHGDCLHLSCWRVAELRERGEKAKIIITRKRSKNGQKRVFHVLVRRGNGKKEDPSKLLGM